MKIVSVEERALCEACMQKWVGESQKLGVILPTFLFSRNSCVFDLLKLTKLYN